MNAADHGTAVFTDRTRDAMITDTPLGFDYINLIGRYHVGLPDAVRRGALRQLRDPNEHEF
ncbi:uncharacterized protein SOCE836_024020 [Sorangium cellulosum]|uniref:Uncharacterized protein n=1 Tax=Sorangium cellulosum TaxID=56 RepID=A0A4V0NFN6_SORCE|nr:uncharacterized protein SOCE836_024020 [Sorangium cellulosum]WCQ89696.1 hypothetical protein NQZ70_02388 [Sorangium sp. Soce836]